MNSGASNFVTRKIFGDLLDTIQLLFCSISVLLVRDSRIEKSQSLFVQLQMVTALKRDSPLLHNTLNAALLSAK